MAFGWDGLGGADVGFDSDSFGHEGLRVEMINSKYFKPERAAANRPANLRLDFDIAVRVHHESPVHRFARHARPHVVRVCKVKPEEADRARVVVKVSPWMLASIAKSHSGILR